MKKINQKYMELVLIEVLKIKKSYAALIVRKERLIYLSFSGGINDSITYVEL